MFPKYGSIAALRDGARFHHTMDATRSAPKFGEMLNEIFYSVVNLKINGFPRFSGNIYIYIHT